LQGNPSRRRRGRLPGRGRGKDSGPMAPPSSSEITALLRAWSLGDDEALPRLMPLVYDELHRAARRHMAGERASHTLQPTALVHEVYLRLRDTAHLDVHSRSHFFAVCA